MTKKDLSIYELSKFIAREAYSENATISRIVEGNPEESLVTGDVLGPLRVISYGGEAYLLRGENIFFSRFRAGDKAEVGVIDKRTKKFKTLKSTSIKLIRFPQPGVIEIFVSGLELFSGSDFELFLLPKSFSGIKWLVRNRLQDLESQTTLAPHRKLDIKKIKESFKTANTKLNSVQKEALEFLIDNDFQGLVQGPPGTGKTHLLVDLVKLALNNNLKVGLASLTNTAVDNALSRILSSGVGPEDVVRIASNKLSVKNEVYGDIEVDDIWCNSFKLLSARSEYDMPQSFSVYAASLHSWCLTKKVPDIDILIIDEASQVPIYFNPFLRSICSRIIMFGDHKQLPPVLQIAKHNLPSEDIFSYEMVNRKYPMLETQYRMNKGIQEWSSNRFYNKKLHPHESVKDRDLLKGVRYERELFGPKEVNLFKHNGLSSGNSNIYEASKTAELIHNLITHGNISASEIGVVSPHRMQAGAICSALQEKLGLETALEVLVDTVERFQGQEREAMILSMGVEKDESRKGDRGFLGDGRRLNVAVTRAKSRFYLMATNKLIEGTKVQKNAVHLNSLFTWCGSNKGSKGEESA